MLSSSLSPCLVVLRARRVVLISARPRPACSASAVLAVLRGAEDVALLAPARASCHLLGVLDRVQVEGLGVEEGLGIGVLEAGALMRAEVQLADEGLQAGGLPARRGRSC